jgi:hypothetical protein
LHIDASRSNAEIGAEVGMCPGAVDLVRRGYAPGEGPPIVSTDRPQLPGNLEVAYATTNPAETKPNDRLSTALAALLADPVAVAKLRAACRRKAMDYDDVITVLKVAAGDAEMPTADAPAPWESVA